MDIINIASDLRVFGQAVPTFPEGISEAFDALVEKTPGGFSRPFYGLSKMNKNGVNYFATALETLPGEGKQLGYEEFTIAKGSYVAVTLKHWRSRLTEIPATFGALMGAEGLDPTHWAVEWYKNDTEMVCMMRLLEKVTA
ncbi:MAG: hypothetical protein RIG68_23510 [Imperialibacter sp.]|uniref:hypothetical protein n=1 Tax=Imperialibacter sp. TaxID=2038411 RepID=UPI0032EBC0B0